MNPKAAMKQLQEYANVPVAELVESLTNPRKTFDEEQLEELTESIRLKGILSPLIVRRENGHFEIVTGARRYRAAQRAGLQVVPTDIRILTDEEALEIQLVENVQRTDVPAVEEAQGFHALLNKNGTVNTIDTVAAKTGKAAAYIAKRLRLVDLVPSAANALTAGQISVEHALLVAKLTPDVQETALEHCFDGHYGSDGAERSLIPASRLQTWIEHNVYLSLKSVPFSKDDEILVPEAGSCVNCPKRTGFNTLLFSEVREDSCTDAACFNRKLDAHIARRVSNTPNLVMITRNYNATGESPILPRRNYIEVVSRKNKKGKDARPEEKLCSHLTAAIHADGMDKGRLVKICTDQNCKIHFGNRQEEEKQRLQWKAEKIAANRKTKQRLAFRHRLLADVLKRVKPQFGTEELRMVAQFVLGSLSHELADRLAKRHGLQNPKDAHDWKMAEKARTLYKNADAAVLAVLIFEAMLLSSTGSATVNKDDDRLADAARLFKVDARTLHAAVAKAEEEKRQKKDKSTNTGDKSKAKAARK